MIPNHAQFLEAIKEKRKVRVQFYSKPDSGVVDRVCAPLDYGLGSETQDGLNRYWLWDYAGGEGSETLGLVPQQIVEMQLLSEAFDPAQVVRKPMSMTGLPLTSPAPPAAATDDSTASHKS
jgi:hypothetical protein